MEKFSYLQKKELRVWNEGNAPDMLFFYSTQNNLRTLLNGSTNQTQRATSTESFWLNAVYDTESGRRIASRFGRMLGDAKASTLTNAGIDVDLISVEGEELTKEQKEANQKTAEVMFNKWSDAQNFNAVELAYSNAEAFSYGVVRLNFAYENGKIIEETIKLEAYEPHLTNLLYDSSGNVIIAEFLSKDTYESKSKNNPSKYKIRESRSKGKIRYEGVKWNTQKFEWTEIPKLDFELTTGVPVPESITYGVDVETFAVFNLGHSNLADSIQHLDKLDEYESREVDNARESDTITVWPEGMIGKEGSLTNARKKRNFMVSKSGRGDKAKQEITTIDRNFNADKYPGLKAKAQDEVIAMYGIDRYTLGMGTPNGNDGEGLANKREQHTARTFSSMINKYTPSMNKLFNMWNYFLENIDKLQIVVIEDGTDVSIDIVPFEELFVYKVTYGDPFTPSFDQKAESLGTTYAQGGVDLKTYFFDLWEDKKPYEEIEKMYERKKVELGLNIDEEEINELVEGDIDEPVDKEDKRTLVEKLLGKNKEQNEDNT